MSLDRHDFRKHSHISENFFGSFLKSKEQRPWMRIIKGKIYDGFISSIFTLSIFVPVSRSLEPGQGRKRAMFRYGNALSLEKESPTSLIYSALESDSIKTLVKGCA